MSELQSPNWNDMGNRMTPVDLDTKVTAHIEEIAKQYNAAPNKSKFMTDMAKGNDNTLGELSDPMGSGGGAFKEKAQDINNSSFVFGGGGGAGRGNSKARKRVEQLYQVAYGGRNNANNFMKPTYKEAKEAARTISRIAAGKSDKGSKNDAFSANSLELQEIMALSGQSLNGPFKGAKINPRDVANNSELAKALVGEEPLKGRDSARNEMQNVSVGRAIGGALNGDEQMQQAAKAISDNVKQEVIQTLDLDKEKMEPIVGQEVAKTIEQHKEKAHAHIAPPSPMAPMAPHGPDHKG